MGGVGGPPDVTTVTGNLGRHTVPGVVTSGVLQDDPCPPRRVVPPTRSVSLRFTREGSRTFGERTPTTVTTVGTEGGRRLGDVRTCIGLSGLFSERGG